MEVLGIVDYKQHVAKSISDFLVEQLDLRSLTVSSLTVILNRNGMSITPKSIHAWIAGTSTPKAEHVLGLADYFGTSTDEILGAYADEFYEEETNND